MTPIFRIYAPEIEKIRWKNGKNICLKLSTCKTAIHFGTIGEKGDKYFLNNGILANSIGFYGFPAKKDTTIE